MAGDPGRFSSTSPQHASDELLTEWTDLVRDAARREGLDVDDGLRPSPDELRQRLVSEGFTRLPLPDELEDDPGGGSGGSGGGPPADGEGTGRGRTKATILKDLVFRRRRKKS